MMEYAGWLAGPFSNVLPMRFEDIVGSAGGGDDKTQLKTLWRLQLAWHVPGRPGDFVEGIFNKRSLTFRKGAIGSYRDEFSVEHHRLFCSLPQDFMRVYGYDGSAAPEDRQAGKEVAAPAQFSTREMAMETASFRSPCLLEEGYRGFNIVRFERQCIGVAQELGDIGAWPPRRGKRCAVDSRGKWIVGKSCHEVRTAIDDRRIQCLEASLRQVHGQVDCLREDLRVFRHSLSLRGRLGAAKRSIEKVIPLSGLLNFFSRHGG